MAGVAAALEGLVQVVAAEPVGCPALHAALAAGASVAVEVGGLAADSLDARIVGQLGLEIARRMGVVSVLLDDTMIRHAQRYLWERLRTVAKPGGAAALGALLSGAWTPPPGSPARFVLCGANTDPGNWVTPSS